jgi:hypothetical protein
LQHDRQRGGAREVGGAQVQAQLLLEGLYGGLVHAPVDGEASDEVHQRAQRRARGRDRAGHGVGVEEVGLHELQALVLLDALQLALDDPGDDHAPAVLQERVRDRGAKAAGPSGDEDGAIAHVPAQ